LLGRALDHLLRAGVDVLLAGVERQEQAGAFHHHVGADVAPLQRRRVALVGQADAAAVDHQRAAVHRDVALEPAVHAVVLEHVGQVVRLQQVVDADDLDVVLEVLRRGAEHHAPDAAEAVDAYLDCHVCALHG
jgi:hypothetical protein